MMRDLMTIRMAAIAMACLAASPCTAQSGAAPVDEQATPAVRAPAENRTDGRFSLRPFVSNMLDKRHDVVAVDTGVSGGSSYVEHVPQAAGLTLRTPL